MKCFLILAIFIFTSCTGTITARTFNQLHHGMSKEDSFQKLGKADSIVQKNGMELHKYSNIYGPKLSHSGCNKCTVVGKCDYFVVYKDGILIEYGQMSHRLKPKSIVTKAFFGS